MVKIWVQHASSHSTDMLIARYGNMRLAEKAIQGIEALLERWEKRKRDTIEDVEDVVEKGVVGCGTVYVVMIYPDELLQQVEAVLDAHSPNDVDRQCEVAN